MDNTSPRTTVNILIIDDEKGIRQFLPTVFKSLGNTGFTPPVDVQAVAVCTCEEGLKLLKNPNRFDAVLADLSTNGGMNGMEFLAVTKDILKANNISAYLVTGYSNVPEDRKDELNELNARCLVKPVSPEEYKKIIASVLQDQAEQHKELELVREDVHLPKRLDSFQHLTQ